MLRTFMIFRIRHVNSHTHRLYATFMMYGCVREELQAMKEGLNDVIPPELLAGLTAEVGCQ